MAIYAEATEGRPQLSIGTHELKCTNIEEDTVDGLREPDIWRFTFECEDELDPDGKPVEIDGIASRYLTPNSKAWAWLEALGMKLEIGKRHNIEDGIGGRALGKITHKTQPNGAKYARLSELVAMPKGRATNASNDVLTEASALANWMDGIRAIGYTTKEIIDHCQSKYGRKPNELTAAEREDLAKELTT